MASKVDVKRVRKERSRKSGGGIMSAGCLLLNGAESLLFEWERDQIDRTAGCVLMWIGV